MPLPSLILTPAPEPPPIVALSRQVFTVHLVNLNTLADFLSMLGYKEIAPSTEHEHARLRDAGALIVIYTTGRVVCQGAEAQRAAQLLRAHCIEQAVLPGVLL
jgi:hypothetical protein